MKRFVTTLGLLLALAPTFAAPAHALVPIPGTYESIDLGGSMQLGRISQSWALAANASLGAADVFNARSWDGTLLGDQWWFACGVQPIPALVNDFRVGGTGSVVTSNTFVGGRFFLDAAGPWSNGIKDLNGTLGITRINVTDRYVAGVLQETRMNIDTDGVFDGSNCTLTFVISNGLGVGNTNSGAIPGDYPALLDPNCQPTRTFGAWGSMSQITLRIDCVVKSNQSTWGAVKTMYR